MSERSTDAGPSPDSSSERPSKRLGRILQRKPTTTPPPPRHAAPPPRSKPNGTGPDAEHGRSGLPAEDHPDQSPAAQRPRPRPRPGGPQDRAKDERANGATAGTPANAANSAPRPRPGPGARRAETEKPDATKADTYAATKTDTEPVDLANTDTASATTDTPATEPAQASSTEVKPADKPEGSEKSEKPAKTRRSLRSRLRRTPWTRRITKLVIVVVVVVAAALLLRTYVVAPYYIPSASMEPTLHGCPGCDDDHVLVDKFSYHFHQPKIGDIVVFDKPPGLVEADSVLIKRVVATGGERLVLRDGFVYVNGTRLQEPYINKACGPHPTKPLTARRSWLVPNDDIFVMGDNRCDSEDSRAFGPIPDSSVVGRAFVIVYPFKDFDFL